jgi:hypothetical protein
MTFIMDAASANASCCASGGVGGESYSGYMSTIEVNGTAQEPATSSSHVRSRAPIPLLTWVRVKKIIEKGELALLGRSDTQQQEYDAFREGLVHEWDSVGDFILHTKFGIGASINLQSSRKYSHRDEITSSRIVVGPNDFPYNFEPGICHVIVWKIGGDLTTEDINECIQQIKNSNAGLRDLAMYINPPALKSIPDVDHAHILYFV